MQNRCEECEDAKKQTHYGSRVTMPRGYARSEIVWQHRKFKFERYEHIEKDIFARMGQRENVKKDFRMVDIRSSLGTQGHTCEKRSSVNKIINDARWHNEDGLSKPHLRTI